METLRSDLEIKTTLAVECAAGQLTVVLMRDGRVIASGHGSDAQAKVGELNRVVRAVLEDAGSSLSELDAVAASIGPGSYTGIRSGLAFLKGIQAGSGLETRMIPLTLAMALSSPEHETVGTAVRVGRSEVAIEVFRQAQRLDFSVVGADVLVDTMTRLTGIHGVEEWVLDPRLEDLTRSASVPRRFVDSSFAELIGHAAEKANTSTLDESLYLASKF